MKRKIALCLAILMLASAALTACGKAEKDGSNLPTVPDISVPDNNVTGTHPQEPVDPAVEPLRVDWEKDMKLKEGEYTWINPDESDDAVRIVFSTSSTLHHVNFYKLTPFENENGELDFEEESLWYQEELTPDMPLLVQTVFYGDLPNNGISYIDSEDNTRKFAVSISGEDGSLILSAYDVYDEATELTPEAQ